ncbi:N-acetyltransferase [Mangrovimicrobium sediminis]|uniref:N-acetyltransferase n=1 Tax=Mangrovimicrobium sediminis TaxID=2562682 RepID=A0A4Z0M556_9GAMM|nr:GNAT family N-acetyltransferase [Haliea sp. SAOS-164]TGD74576.1 N-acetyltransferase [Haliea sp. SAOS-164]
MQGYRITTRVEEMDLDAIHAFITRSYWASGIPRETLVRAIANSLNFGVLGGGGEQVGFARMVTDRATFAYLADVYILEAHRGRGLSKWLMSTILEHPDLQGLRRMLLGTRDAHGLYRQFGFTALGNPEVFMQRWQPDVYAGSGQG